MSRLMRVVASTAVFTLAACAQSGRSTPRVQPGELPPTWYAGGAECKDTPPFRVHAYNSDFFILRQAACTNFEKPFLYLIFGRERALLLDTGAGAVDLATPIDTLTRNWLRRTGRPAVELVVAHSHAHGDHVAADSQFVGEPRTKVVARDTASVRWFFGVKNWPEDVGHIDLGGRVLDVIPIPGHQPASIAVYDRRTGVMLTGDTFYPGRLYVRDTLEYSRSIDRLTAFANEHVVVHFLGAHIENRREPGRDYPEGTVDQPDEHELQLNRAQLFQLDSAVRAMRGRFIRAVLPDFTIWPLTP
jgi:glyoxylase-like metal-dependent hydrolase (beta-lactamase superfamily II)